MPDGGPTARILVVEDDRRSRPCSRELVRLHGGTVDVQSEPNRGSLFVVRLPNA